MPVSFDKVSLTAKLAAYMRQYSDIPFAKDVAQELHAPEAFEQLLRESGLRPEDLFWYAPVFEARYKSIAQTIRDTGMRQVIELASGLSLRGLAMSQDPSITYVETDLQELTQEKAALVDLLRRQYHLASGANHRLATANALELPQLRAAMQGFRHDQPIAVVNEGLFPYLSAGEMETVAHNVRALLAEFGGVWITPDFSLRENVTNVSAQQRQFRSAVDAATGRPLYNHSFESDEQLQAFIAGLGLQERRMNQLDVAPGLACMETLHLSPLLLERLKPRLNLWVLSLPQ